MERPLVQKPIVQEEPMIPAVNEGVSPGVLNAPVQETMPTTETINRPTGLKGINPPPPGPGDNLSGGGPRDNDGMVLDLGNRPGSLVTSWESNADKQAQIKFQQDANAAMQAGFRNAAENQRKGLEGQTQLALGEYMLNQSAEKAGWTGGYMLDQRRQGEYLRASIQAQMYGAQELQKYGIDTQLEAARLAYDLGKEQLAYQLYQQEQQTALTEAQMFGYYVSPEIKDMMNQMRAAQSVMTSTTATTEEKNRAQAIVTQINTWFGDDIDPNDIRTFSELTMEREQWNQAKLDAALATVNDDPSTFLARDNEGRYITDANTGQYVKVNFQDINADDLRTFLGSDDEAGSKFADQAVKSYMRYLGQSTINAYFTSLKTDEEATNEGFLEWIEENPNQMFDWLKQTMGGTDDPTIKAALGGSDEFIVNLTGGKGSVSVKFNLKTGLVQGQSATETTTTPTETSTFDYSVEPENVISDYKSTYKDYWKVNGTEDLSFDTLKENYNWWYGSSAFNSSTEIAQKFESDLLNYKAIVDGTFDTGGNQFYNSDNVNKIDNLVGALTAIRGGNSKNPEDVLKDIFVQTFKSKTGVDLSGTKLERSKVESMDANGSSNDFHILKIKTSELTAANKQAIKSAYPNVKEEGGFLTFAESTGKTPVVFRGTSNKLNYTDTAMTYRLILLSILRS